MALLLYRAAELPVNQIAFLVGSPERECSVHHPLQSHGVNVVEAMKLSIQGRGHAVVGCVVLV